MSKIYVLTHLGLGDMINIVGMIRYLATIHDEVMIATKHRKELEYVYANESRVTLREVANDREAREVPFNYKLLTSGIHKGNYENDVPFVFYRDSNVDERCFWTHFYIPNTLESEQLYASLKHQEYIVVHNNTSRGELFSLNSVKQHYLNDVLIVDLNNEEFMRSLVHYKDLLINAAALYLSDSCIFCLALNLELKSNKCYYISRNGRSYDYLYKNIENVNRKRFKQLTLR